MVSLPSMATTGSFMAPDRVSPTSLSGRAQVPSLCPLDCRSHHWVQVFLLHPIVRLGFFEPARLVPRIWYIRELEPWLS